MVRDHSISHSHHKGTNNTGLTESTFKFNHGISFNGGYSVYSKGVVMIPNITKTVGVIDEDISDPRANRVVAGRQN